MKRKLRLTKILVIDLESLCWDGDDLPEGAVQETIEIGTAWLHNNGSVEHGESIIIKPLGKVSKFCTELTGYTQEFLDKNGIPLGRATKRLVKSGSAKYIWTSWGEWDKRFLIEDCKAKNVTYPFSDAHWNIKSKHAFSRKLDSGIGLEEALKMEKMEFIGRPHVGADDAYNAARILGRITYGN